MEDLRMRGYVQRIQNSWFFDVAGFFKIYLRVKALKLKARNGPERSWTRNGSMCSSPDQSEPLICTRKLRVVTSRPHLTGLLVFVLSHSWLKTNFYLGRNSLSRREAFRVLTRTNKNNQSRNPWLWFHFIFKLILGLVPLVTGEQTRCPANEEWSSCGSACAERYCCDGDDRGHCKNLECPEVCEERCECIKGYARDLRNPAMPCVPKADCLAQPATTTSPAPPACPDNEVYNNCYKGYEPFCCDHSLDAKSSRQFAQVNISLICQVFLLIKPSDW